MTTLSPQVRDGNRGKALQSPPFKYDDNTWVSALKQIKHADLGVWMVRMLVNMSVTPRVYGPIRLPMFQRAIIAATGAPFVYGPTNPTVTAGDENVFRPVIAIREPRAIELCLLPMQLDYIPVMTATGTGVAPYIDDIQEQLMAADFYTDYAKASAVRGAAPSSQTKPCTITHVQDDGVNADDATKHDYQYMLNSGARIQVTVAPASVATAGDEYPVGQSDERTDYTVLNHWQEQNRQYPNRNLFPVPNRSPLWDHNQPANQNNNPCAIVKVDVVHDYPLNPTTLVKRVTLVSGQTVTEDYDTVTIIGREIGQGSGTQSTSEEFTLTEWVAFDVTLVTMTSVDDDSLAGRHLDPWPLPCALYNDCLTGEPASTSTGTGR